MASDPIQNETDAFELPAAVNENGAKSTSSTDLTTAIHEIESEEYTTYPVHITCPSCKHFHRHKKLKISKDPTEGSRFYCDTCRKPLFGVGRSSTQVTFASAESRQPNVLHLSLPLQQICTDRLHRRLPSRLRSTVSTPSPPEPAASPTQTPAVAPSSEGVVTGMNKQHSTSGGNVDTQVSGTNKKVFRRRLLSGLSKFGDFPRMVMARLRLRRRRRQEPRSIPPHEAEEFGPGRSDSPSSTMKHNPHEQSVSAGTFYPAKPSLSSKITSNRSQSLPPGGSSFDRRTMTAGSDEHPKRDEVRKRRMERTFMAKAAVPVECGCFSGCPCRCKCRNCECPVDSHEPSDPSSSNGTPTPANDDIVPGHILDRPGRPFLVAVGGQFDEEPHLSPLAANLEMFVGDPATRLSQLSTVADTHETRAPSTDSSTLDPSNGGSRRLSGSSAPDPRTDLDLSEAEMFTDANHYNANDYGDNFDLLMQATNQRPTSQPTHEHGLGDEGDVPPADDSFSNAPPPETRHHSAP